jgi:glycosyltransferase involved in cell wall biosynthesis
MKKPSISVVIPTRNRCDVLALTLRALDLQEEITGRLEVVVVDDGSDDSTVKMLRNVNGSAFDLKTFALEHGGPARARNRGIAEASADRILLLGDDTIPVPKALSCHIEAAACGDIGVLGMIEWDTEIGVTDVMRFLAPEGPQFWFKGLGDGSRVPWTSVVSANLSAPRWWFLEEPFDERFSEACFEDTEMAWRWAKRGWRVIFDPRALCRHRHHYGEIGTFLARQRRAGQWARIAAKRHPGPFLTSVAWPLAWIPVLAMRAGWRALCGGWRREDWWDLRCRFAFANGLIFGRR